MISTAIILAGGLGTRLQSVVNEVPKCMAPVAGKPFLKYLIDELIHQGITHFIFSVGYKRDVIIDFIHTDYPHLQSLFAIEQEPLGTGGAIKLAAALCKEKNVFVLNGDTIFQTDLHSLSNEHYSHQATCTLSLKPMHNFDRYGVVEINDKSEIVRFKEKQFYKEGLINGGVYVLNVNQFLSEPLPEKFSFEKEYLEQYYQQRNMRGFMSNGYFIDIGIPEDYERAQTELPQL